MDVALLSAIFHMFDEPRLHLFSAHSLYIGSMHDVLVFCQLRRHPQQVRHLEAKLDSQPWLGGTMVIGGRQGCVHAPFGFKGSLGILMVTWR